MIRTTLSVCALLAALLLASRWIVLSNASTAETRRSLPAASIPAQQTPPPASKPTAAASEARASKQASSATKPESTEVPGTTKIKLQPVAGAPFKMPDGCVEIQLEHAHKIEGANTDGRERVSVAKYLHGPIPTPHDYVARPVDFEEEPADETDDIFGILPDLRVARNRDGNRAQITDVSGDEEMVDEASEDEADSAEKEPARFGEYDKAIPDDDGVVELGIDDEMTEDNSTDTETNDTVETEIELDGDRDTNTTPTKSAKKEIELTPELIALREKLRDTLAHYYYRPENVASRSPWGAMHYMLAYGVDSQLVAGNRKVNGVGWLCYNGVCNGQNLFWGDHEGLHARIGVGVQGHAGQFLAMLAQSKVPTDFPIKASGQDFTVADLIQHEKDTCQPNTELTFKLIALVHYCKSDEQWISNEGQEWDIPRLIKEELRQPIIGAACGGTHRLMGFSYAIRKRQQRGEEFTGQWLRAKTFIDDYHEYTFRLQNPDGSFSTEWFVGRGDHGLPGRRLETTGHITEWLSYSLTEEELVEPRMVSAVTYLTDLLHDGRNSKWNIGPLGHGLHALAIYDERVFGGKPGQREEQLASHEKVLANKRTRQEPSRR